MNPSPDPAAAAPGRRPRVAVVFGGRSGEHAISCITAGERAARPRPGRYDVVADRHHARRALGARRRRPRALAITRRPPARGRRTTAHGARAAASPATASSRCSSRARCRARSARSTSSSRCCTARSARTARCRACSSWPTSAYVGSGVLACAAGDGQARHEAAARRGRAPGRRLPRGHRPASGTATPTAVAVGRRGARLPGLRQARAGRVEPGHHPGRRARPTWTPPSRRPAGTTRRIVVEAEIERPRDRVRRARVDRRRRAGDERCPARSRSAPATSSTTSRPSTSTRTTCGSTLPGRPAGRRRRPRPRPGRPDVRGAGLRGAGPGRLLRRAPTARSLVNEINTMPGLHADLDVPADVGRDRPGLPRAGRPARAARPAPAHRAALTLARRHACGRWLGNAGGRRAEVDERAPRPTAARTRPGHGPPRPSGRARRA